MASTRPTWCSAVFAEMNSRSPISALVRPCADRSSTSASRAVSDGHDRAASVDAWTGRRAERPQQRGGAVATPVAPEPLEAPPARPEPRRSLRRGRRARPGRRPAPAAPRRAARGRSSADEARAWRRSKRRHRGAWSPRRRVHPAAGERGLGGEPPALGALGDRRQLGGRRARRRRDRRCAARPAPATASSGARRAGRRPRARAAPAGRRRRRGRARRAPRWSRGQRRHADSWSSYGSTSAAASSIRPWSMRRSARWADRRPPVPAARATPSGPSASSIDRLRLLPAAGAAEHRAVARARQWVCSTRGRPPKRSRISCGRCRSTPRRGAGRRRGRRTTSIEQKLMPATAGRRTSPAVIAASASSRRAKPSRIRPWVTSARPPSASARTSRSRSPNSTAMSSARSALASRSSTSVAVARQQRDLEVAPLRRTARPGRAAGGPARATLPAAAVAERPVVEVARSMATRPAEREVAAVAEAPERRLRSRQASSRRSSMKCSPASSCLASGRSSASSAASAAADAPGGRRFRARPAPRGAVRRLRPRRQRNRWSSSGKCRPPDRVGGQAKDRGVQFSPDIRDEVADGTITVSYRLWSRPKVKVGGIYRSASVWIEIDEIDLVPSPRSPPRISLSRESPTWRLRGRAAHAGPIHDDTSSTTWSSTLRAGRTTPGGRMETWETWGRVVVQRRRWRERGNGGYEEGSPTRLAGAGRCSPNSTNHCQPTVSWWREIGQATGRRHPEDAQAS